MPTINIGGIGRVRTTKKLPKRLRKRPKKTNLRLEASKVIFANRYLVKGERARIIKRLQKKQEPKLRKL